MVATTRLKARWERVVEEKRAEDRRVALEALGDALEHGPVSGVDLAVCAVRAGVFTDAGKPDVAWAVREYVAARGLEDTRGCLLELAAVALAAAAALPPA